MRLGTFMPGDREIHRVSGHAFDVVTVLRDGREVTFTIRKTPTPCKRTREALARVAAARQDQEKANA